MKTIKISLSIIVMLCFSGLNTTMGQWLYNGTNIYNSNTGNVGIGNSSPAKLLNVGKNMTEPTIAVRNFGGLGGATYEMIDDASGADWKFKATNTGGFKIRDNAFGKDIMTIEANSAANSIFVKADGNVGIGTINPLQKFQINGRISVANETDFSFLFFTLDDNFPQGNAGIVFDYINSHKGWIYWSNSLNALKFCTGQTGDRNDLTISSTNGWVGINTASPLSRFDNTFARFGLTPALPHYFYHSEEEADGDGQAAIYGFRDRADTQNSGGGYSITSCNSGIKGYTFWGDNYAFGVTGYSDNDYYRTGGVFGAQTAGSYWGALGYKSSGNTTYGGYFTSYLTGSGKSGPQPMIGIGVGAWGDLMAADFHGKIYGIYSEGGNYAMFSHGVTYKDNLDVHLQENSDGSNTVMYTNVSTDATIQTSGIATLSEGRANIAFDPSFAAVVSSEAPVIVTVTPIGESNGVHLTEVTSAGFIVAENNAGKSSVTVNYIAIGKRAGYEKPILAKEVIEAGYTDKVSRGLKPDANTQENSDGLYYENGQLIVGVHPSTLRDPNKKSVVRVRPVEQKSSSVSQESAYSPSTIQK
jgi:hypothetical protein